MAIKMIVLDIYLLDDSEHGADKVERIDGTYDGKYFELDRVYSGENKEEETYDEIEVEWYEGDDSITEE